MILLNRIERKFNFLFNINSVLSTKYIVTFNYEKGWGICYFSMIKLIHKFGISIANLFRYYVTIEIFKIFSIYFNLLYQLLTIKQNFLIDINPMKFVFWVLQCFSNLVNKQISFILSALSSIVYYNILFLII